MKKNSVIILFLFLLAQSSFARVVAEKVHTGGFMTDFAPSTHLQIADTGLVTVKRADVSTVVAQLSRKTMAELKKLIEAVPDKAVLVVDSPTGPELMDGPSTTYSVLKRDGTEVTIAHSSNGRMAHVQIAEQKNVYQIESILQGLGSVAELVKY